MSLELLHIYLSGDGRCGKSFFIRIMPQSLTKILSYMSTLLDKSKELLMAPSRVTAINIDDTMLYTALILPVGHHQAIK